MVSMSTVIDSRCALYSWYSRVFEYGKDNWLTSYIKGVYENLSEEDKKEHEHSLHIMDAGLYILLYYGIHSDFKTSFDDISPEINSMLIGESDADCSLIEPEDVVELYDSIFRHIPFEGYDRATEKMDFAMLQNLLESVLGFREIYEPYSGLYSFCLPYSWKFVSDRSEYLILSVYSVLAQEKIRRVLEDRSEQPVSRERRVIHGAENTELSVSRRNFSSVILSGVKDMDNMELAIRKGLNMMSDDGVMVIFDSEYVIGKGSKDYRKLGVEDNSLSLRKYLIDSNILDAIYDDYIEIGDADASIYVLKKGRTTDKVRIFGNKYRNSGYGDDMHSDSVSTDVIKRLGYTFEGTDLYGIPDVSSFEIPCRLDDWLEYCYVSRYDDSYGKILSLQDFDRVRSRDVSSFAVEPSLLKEGTVSGSYKKVVEPVLVISPFLKKVQMVYVKASGEEPVYVPADFFVFRINTRIITPEYVYYLYQNGMMQLVMGDIDAKQGNEMDFLRDWDVMQLPIPVSKEEQMKRLKDAELFWKVEADKEFVREKLFNEKEWLNERHIRNIKHRLRDDLAPLSMGISKLKKSMSAHGGILRYSDIVGVRSKQTAGSLISSLAESCVQLSDSLEDLTTASSFGVEDCLDISSLIKGYRESYVSKDNHMIDFVEHVSHHIEIKMSRKSFKELLTCIVSNAERHGFTDSSRSDYHIRITLSERLDRKCRILVENNGTPMSARAEDVYFICGEYAGDTGRSGIGGSRVKDIVEHFGGEVRLLNDKSEYPVKIEMLFPIVNVIS